MRRALAAIAVLLWHHLWFAAGYVAGLLWAIIVLAALAALAGFHAGRYR